MNQKWKSHHENDGLAKYGGRDVVGYAGKSPFACWPKGKQVALNFVINYEEGSENCLLHGDSESEKLLSEIVGADAYGTNIFMVVQNVRTLCSFVIVAFRIEDI
jgi:hypothetical protein